MQFSSRKSGFSSHEVMNPFILLFGELEIISTFLSQIHSLIEKCVLKEFEAHETRVRCMQLIKPGRREQEIFEELNFTIPWYSVTCCNKRLYK